MSNTKQILKDAIADAKAVRETALAQAKLALEEAFTPQLQSMLAAKLNEMEEEDDKMEEAKKADDQMEETLDLEALLAEADDEEEKEAEGETSEEAPEEESGESEEDKDITEMSPEEVEEYIRQIAAEEFTKLEAGQGEEIPGEEGEEIDLDAELGAEAPAGEEEEINLDEMMDDMANEEEIDENDINIDELLAEFGLSEEEVEEGYGKDEDADDKSKMEEELAQALATIDELRSSIQEVNLLNAKLLYMNKVFKGTNLTESQKIDVVKTFDKAETAKEAKLVYESMITTFTKKAEVKSNIKESVGFASKAVGMISGNSNAKVIETDAQYSRWEKLAFGK